VPDAPSSARTPPRKSRTYSPARAEGHTVGLRGAGCSYGDAALNDGQIVLDTSGMNRVLAWDPIRGEIMVEPGVATAQRWRQTLADLRSAVECNARELTARDASDVDVAIKSGCAAAWGSVSNGYWQPFDSLALASCA
jgi:hypothetical protein